MADGFVPHLDWWCLKISHHVHQGERRKLGPFLVATGSYDALKGYAYERVAYFREERAKGRCCGGDHFLLAPKGKCTVLENSTVQVAPGDAESIADDSAEYLRWCAARNDLLAQGLLDVNFED